MFDEIGVDAISIDSVLFIDHVTLAMLTHLCGTYGGARPGTPFSKGGMTRLQSNRAKEFTLFYKAAA